MLKCRSESCNTKAATCRPEQEDQQLQAAEAIGIKCNGDVNDLRAVCLVLAIVDVLLRVVGDGNVDGGDGCEWWVVDERRMVEWADEVIFMRAWRGWLMDRSIAR